MAMEEEYGLIVQVEDPLLLRTRLYPERKKDILFECLSFVLSPTAPESELWIVRTKREPQDAEEI